MNNNKKGKTDRGASCVGIDIDKTESLGDSSFDALMSLSDSKKEIALRDDRYKHRTRSLFVEYKHPSYDAYWTLKNHDYKGYKSLKKIYMDLRDPTEALIATQVFTSLEHWEILSNTWFFKPVLDKWREELEVLMRAEALVELQKQAKNSVSAAQFLAKGNWKEKRGRPSKEEKKGILKKAARVQDEVDRLFKLQAVK